MLKIEQFALPSPKQWEMVIAGMRNPLNSWNRSDSYKTHIEDVETLETADFEFFLGENDHDLMMRLVEGGSEHRKFMRMLPVWVTIDAPLYYWKEFDTYKVGTVCNSCSTMHKIHAKPFTPDDFSHEHLNSVSMECLSNIIRRLNRVREQYLISGDKNDWWQLIQILPSSYNQRRTIMLNYEVLATIYHQRKNHKLDEWHSFCDWIRNLPHNDLITGEEGEG